MSDTLTDDQILAAFPPAPNTLRVRELARRLGLPPVERAALGDHLRQMAHDGLLEHCPGNRYGRAQHKGEVTGSLTLHPRGFGFVALDGGGEDVYVRPDGIGNALHRDRVRLSRRMGPRGPEGTITAVLERGLRTFVATVRQTRRGLILTAHDPRMPEEVALDGGLQVEEGDLVAADFTAWPGEPGGPSARVLKRLGGSGEVVKETDLIVYDLGLPVDFPDAVEAEAGAYEVAVTDADRKRRHDLTERPLFTIDPESAKDFDDAIACRPRVEGGWHLTVAIADVGHFVRLGTALDDEARSRGTSVYLPDRVLPMLPHALSSDLCSLRPGVDRLAMVVEVEVYPDGVLGPYSFYEAVIHSHGRFTYDRAAALLGVRSEDDRPTVDADPDLEALRPGLEALRDATRARRRFRSRRGYLNLDLPEPRIILGTEGEVADIGTYERHEAHLMVEEAMLMANEVVAMHLIEHELPGLYRVHPRPPEDALAWFKDQAELFGAPLKVKGRITPGQLTRYLKKLGDHPSKRILQQLLLRSMAKAIYDEEPGLHFGLGTDRYLHFTSPIRRYPDLVVHRLLKARIHEADHPEDDRLGEIAEHSSRRERLALEAERSVADLYKAMYAREHLGEVDDATIISVASFGLFVELKSHLIEGLVPIERLGGDFFEANEAMGALIGRRTGKRYRLGDRITVRIANADIRRRRVDFDLVDDQTAETD